MGHQQVLGDRALALRHHPLTVNSDDFDRKSAQRRDDVRHHLAGRGRQPDDNRIAATRHDDALGQLGGKVVVSL